MEGLTKATVFGDGLDRAWASSICFQNQQNSECTSFGFLIFPRLFQRSNVYIASFSFAYDALSASNDGRVYHASVQSPGSTSLLDCFGVRYHYSNSPFQLLLAGCKRLLNNIDLTGMDALLAVESQTFATDTFFFQSLQTFNALVRRTYKIDSRWEFMCSTCCCNG